MSTQTSPLYSEVLADEICAKLSDGQSLRKICQAEGMPDRRTVERWMASDESFAAKCARARDYGTDLILDDMEDIETGTLKGTIDPRAASVVLSSKQWRASKLAPKKYGTIRPEMPKESEQTVVVIHGGIVNGSD